MMAMASRLRQVALLAHVVASVGWLGAVAVFRDDRDLRSPDRDRDELQSNFSPPTPKHR